MAHLHMEGSRPPTQKYHIFEPILSLGGAEDSIGFFRSKQNCDSILSIINQLMVSEPIKIITLDVFDTVLLRENKSEARRFWELSENFVQHAQETESGAAFETTDAFMARILAARAAYSISPPTMGYVEGKFKDIARITCQLLNRSDLVESYISNELQYEIHSTTNNPILDCLREQWPQLDLVYISDMYLESDKIEGLLLKKGIKTTARTRVFSSADGFGCKRNGSIFKVVEEQLEVSGRQLLHIGDNLCSDYQMAKLQGWNALYLPIPDQVKSVRRQCYDTLSQDLASYGITLENYLKFNY